MDPLFFNLSGMSDLQLTLAEERLRLGLPFEQHPGPLLDATMALGPDLEATHPLAEGSGGPIGVRQGQDTGAGGSDDVYLNQMAIVGWNPNMTAFPLRDRPEPLGLFEVSLADAMRAEGNSSTQTTAASNRYKRPRVDSEEPDVSTEITSHQSVHSNPNMYIAPSHLLPPTTEAATNYRINGYHISEDNQLSPSKVDMFGINLSPVASKSIGFVLKEKKLLPLFVPIHFNIAKSFAHIGFLLNAGGTKTSVQNTDRVWIELSSDLGVDTPFPNVIEAVRTGVVDRRRNLGNIIIHEAFCLNEGGCYSIVKILEYTPADVLVQVMEQATSLSVEEFKKFLERVVPNDSGRRVLPLASGHEGYVPFQKFESLINGTAAWKKSALKAYAPQLYEYIDESTYAYQNLILEGKTTLFPEKDDIRGSQGHTLRVWNAFVARCKEKNQDVNFAVRWSDDHPVRNLVEAHYYQQLRDTYNAVRRSLQSEIRVYMAAYVKSLPTPKIKYLLETFQGILQNFKTNKPENPDVAKKTLMEEHSSQPFRHPLLLSLIPKVLSSKVPMNLDRDQIDDMHPNAAFSRHLFFSGVTEELVGGIAGTMLFLGIRELSEKEKFFKDEAQKVQFYEWQDVVDAMIKRVRVVVSAERDGAAPGALLQEIQGLCQTSEEY